MAVKPFSRQKNLCSNFEGNPYLRIGAYAFDTAHSQAISRRAKIFDGAMTF
jgi:hypothetical protein